MFCVSRSSVRLKTPNPHSREITTEHPPRSYGQPVIVLPDGGSLDLFSWVAGDYRVVRATKAEREALVRLGLVHQ
jgi:hypothetical protein